MRTLPFVLGLAILAAGCRRHPSSQTVVLTGSSTIAPLAQELAHSYESTHPGVRVDVQSGGSARGISDARAGRADIGMVSRALKPEESDLSPHTIARDGVALIVNAENPVTALSKAQIADIYTGRARSWSEVGGKDSQIVVVNKAEGRSTLEVFLGYLGLHNEQVRADVVIGENEQGIKTVAANPSAIGYVSIGTAEVDIHRGVPIRMVAIDGHEPSTEAVARGEWPILRDLNLVTRGEPTTPLTRDFVEFARSKGADALISQQGFVPAAR